MFCISLFVLFLLTIVLSVLRFKDSDYLFGIFKLFFCLFILFLLAIVVSVLLRLTTSDYAFGILKLLLLLAPHDICICYSSSSNNILLMTISLLKFLGMKFESGII
jgi:hypothetical protein